MHVGCILLLYILYKVTLWIVVSLKTNYINKHSCNNFAHALNDKCDIYLQFGSTSCPSSLKLYLGSLIGSPQQLRVNNMINPENVVLTTCWMHDKFTFNWDKHLIENTSKTYVVHQGGRLYLPNTVKIPLLQKLLGRHLFAKEVHTRNLTIVLVYNDKLLMHSVKLNAQSTNDVECGFKSLQDAIYALKPKVSTPKEGGDSIDDLDLNLDDCNFRRQLSAHLRKVRCVHCENDTYVKEQDNAEDEFVVVESHKCVNE